MKFTYLFTLLSFTYALNIPQVGSYNPQTLPNLLETCGNKTDAMTIETLKITPWPLISGQDIRIQMKGQIYEPILNGSVISISGGADTPLPPLEYDFCSVYRATGQQCTAIKVGPYDVDFTIPFPSEIPGGMTIRMTLNVTNGPNEKGAKDSLTCLTGLVSIALPSQAGGMDASNGNSCGNGTINNGVCEMANQCCSRWGWCGNTPKHCGKGDCVGGACWLD